MKKITFYLLLCVVTVTTGCPPKYSPNKVNFKNPDGYVKDLNDYFMRQQAYYMSVLPSDPEKAKRARNETIDNVLPYIDASYADFVNDIARGRDRANFVADVIELGTSAAVGITKGERAIQILGIALTAFRGGRRSADLNFYKDQSTPILISKMDGNRAKVHAIILQREKDDVSTYTMGAAISDIVEYINAGTLVRAFTELQKDTAVNTRQAEDDLLVLKGVPLTRPATIEEAVVAQNVLPVLEQLDKALNGTDAVAKAAAVKKLQNIYVALEKDGETLTLLKVADLSSAETDGQKLLDGLVRIKRTLAIDSPVQGKINKAILDNGK